MFEEMMQGIRLNISKVLSFIEIKSDVPEPEKENLEHLDIKEKTNKENSNNKKIPRNAICPLCDSGKKYKRCCGKI